MYLDQAAETLQHQSPKDYFQGLAALSLALQKAKGVQVKPQKNERGAAALSRESSALLREFRQTFETVEVPA